MVDLLTMASQHQNAVLDSEQERPMLEGALTFLVILTSLRIHLGKWSFAGSSQSASLYVTVQALSKFRLHDQMASVSFTFEIYIT